MFYLLPVALGFCRNDCELAYRNLEWQQELGNRWPDIVLSYDTLTPSGAVRKIEALAKEIYERVSVHVYQPPHAYQWPPNVAFRETAFRMARQDKSWFWHEADCIPIQPDWLGILSRRYHQFGKPFYCPLIPDLGHYNGTGVYPHNTPSLIPRGLADHFTAWDVASKWEMHGKTADAMPVLFHAWTVSNGVFSHSAGGEPAKFDNREQLRQLPPSATFFHRDKFATIIRFLRECKIEAEKK